MYHVLCMHIHYDSKCIHTYSMQKSQYAIIQTVITCASWDCSLFVATNSWSPPSASSTSGKHYHKTTLSQIFRDQWIVFSHKLYWHSITCWYVYCLIFKHSWCTLRHINCTGAQGSRTIRDDNSSSMHSVCSSFSSPSLEPVYDFI